MPNLQRCDAGPSLTACRVTICLISSRIGEVGQIGASRRMNAIAVLSSVPPAAKAVDGGVIAEIGCRPRQFGYRGVRCQ